MKKKELSSTQMKAIASILAGNSIVMAAKKAGVSRGIIHVWLKDGLFKGRLEQERKALFEEGLSTLMVAINKAAKTLIELLESNDENIKRLAASQIINMALRLAEIRDFEERISRIEEIIKQENDSSRGRMMY